MTKLAHSSDSYDGGRIWWDESESVIIWIRWGGLLGTLQDEKQDLWKGESSWWDHNHLAWPFYPNKKSYNMHYMSFQSSFMSSYLHDMLLQQIICFIMLLNVLTETTTLTPTPTPRCKNLKKNIITILISLWKKLSTAVDSIQCTTFFSVISATICKTSKEPKQFASSTEVYVILCKYELMSLESPANSVR